MGGAEEDELFGRSDSDSDQTDRDADDESMEESPQVDVVEIVDEEEKLSMVSLPEPVTSVDDEETEKLTLETEQEPVAIRDDEDLGNRSVFNHLVEVKITRSQDFAGGDKPA